MAEHDSVIPAGRSGKLVAKVHTSPRQHGAYSKSIAVSTDDDSLGVIRLTLNFRVITPITVEPKNRLYLSLVEGDSATDRVLLHRTDGKPLQILGIEPTEGQPFTLRLIPVVAGGQAKPDAESRVEAAPGDVWLEASVAKGVTPMQQTTTLRLETNHPGLKSLDLPITVRIRPVVEAHPERVELWLDEHGPRRSTIVRVSSSRRQSFTIREVAVDDPDLLSVKSLTKGPASTFNLRVSLNPELEAAAIGASRRATIRVALDLPAERTLEIPVVVRPRSPNLRRAPRIMRPERRPVAPRPIPTRVPPT